LAILQSDVDPAITIQKQQVEREAIVVRGQFKYQPHEDARSNNFVILYSDPYVAYDGSGGGTGTLDDFFKELGDHVGMQVVNAVKDDRPATVSWSYRRSSKLSEPSKDQQRSDKLDSLLKNVTTQMGLTFTREKRNVDVWMIGHKEVAAEDIIMVKGIVLDEAGQPVGGAKVGLPPSSGIVKQTDNQGRFTLWVERQYLVPSGELYLMVRHLERNLAACLMIEHSVDDLKVTVKKGIQVTGRFIQKNGQPAGNVRVGILLNNLNLVQGQGWTGGFTYRDGVVTGADGRFIIQAIPRPPSSAVAKDMYYTVFAPWDQSYRNNDKTYRVNMNDATAAQVDIGDIDFQLADDAPQ
jgi:hypothetical protein